MTEHLPIQSDPGNALHFPADVAHLPTSFGDFTVFTVTDADGLEHVVIVNPSLDMAKPVLVRLHSECFTGDTLGSQRCDCQEQLHVALRTIGKHGGVLLYLRQEGRGTGLTNKLRAYALQEKGLDTVEAQEALHLPIDAREYGFAVSILKELGVSRVCLMTNNPAKMEALQQQGIEVTHRVPIEIVPGEYNGDYLRTKQEKMGHLFGEE